VIGSSVRARTPVRLRFPQGVVRDAVLVIDPNSVPHIWAIAGPLVVTIAGTLDADELTRIAASLRPRA
jgi:hypothetical protein